MHASVSVFVQRAKFRASIQSNEVFPKGGAGMHAFPAVTTIPFQLLFF